MNSFFTLLFLIPTRVNLSNYKGKNISEDLKNYFDILILEQSMDVLKFKILMKS